MVKIDKKSLSRTWKPNTPQSRVSNQLKQTQPNQSIRYKPNNNNKKINGKANQPVDQHSRM